MFETYSKNFYFMKTASNKYWNEYEYECQSFPSSKCLRNRVVVNSGILCTVSMPIFKGIANIQCKILCIHSLLSSNIENNSISLNFHKQHNIFYYFLAFTNTNLSSDKCYHLKWIFYNLCFLNDPNYYYFFLIRNN